MSTMFPAKVMVLGVVSSEGDIMPPHFFQRGLRVNAEVYVDVMKDVVKHGSIRWPGGAPTSSNKTAPLPTMPR